MKDGIYFHTKTLKMIEVESAFFREWCHIITRKGYVCTMLRKDLSSEYNYLGKV